MRTILTGKMQEKKLLNFTSNGNYSFVDILFQKT